MRIKHGDASVWVSRQGGSLFVHDLQSYGSAADLMRVVREVQEIARSEPVYIHVVLNNPKFERLVKFYERVGAKQMAVIMEMGGK